MLSENTLDYIYDKINEKIIGLFPNIHSTFESGGETHKTKWSLLDYWQKGFRNGSYEEIEAWSIKDDEYPEDDDSATNQLKRFVESDGQCNPYDDGCTVDVIFGALVDAGLIEAGSYILKIWW